LIFFSDGGFASASRAAFEHRVERAPEKRMRFFYALHANFFPRAHSRANSGGVNSR
jgi:hypothetical protein